RPVLLIRPQGAGPRRVAISVENVGRGPALEIRAEMHGYDLPSPGLAKPSNGILKVGEVEELVWDEIGPFAGPLAGSVVCRDLSHWVYVTRFILSQPEGADPTGTQWSGAG